MVAALDNEAAFDDKNLIGAADGGEPVGDDEGGAALHELVEAGLDHGLRFGVERAGGFVENEDARLGKKGAGDGEALALAAGELDAALADDGVVGFREALGELIDAGGAAGKEKLLFGGVGAGEEDVLADGAVEEERVLQDDAELRAEGVEVDVRKVDTVDEDAAAGGRVEGAEEADDGGLAGAGGADERGDGAGLCVEADAMQDGLALARRRNGRAQSGRCPGWAASSAVRPGL